MEFDQNYSEASVVRELHDGTYDWEEWQVYLGKASVKNGEIVVYLSDEGGLIDFYEANITGLVLQSDLFEPRQLIFKDGFESGHGSRRHG